MFKESEDRAIRSLHIPAQAVPPSLEHIAGEIKKLRF
jgi:hypothetical protein